MKSYKLNTNAIVVIESIWPAKDDYRGETAELNKYFKTFVQSEIHQRASVYQSKYLGYYKIIPLNISSISVTNNKEQNSFNISFSGDYLYFGTDENLPPHIFFVLQEKLVNINNITSNYPFLEKLLNGDSNLKYHFVTNYATIAEFISEMDTVSIYLINAPENISLRGNPKQNMYPMEIFTGANPGRTKEPETKALKNEQNRILNNYGLSENELGEIKKAIESNDFSSLIYFWRKFSLNFIVNKKSHALLGQLFPEVARDFIEKEKTTYQKPDTINDLYNTIGPLLAFRYFPLSLENKDKVGACIEKYYSKGNYVSKVISFSGFEYIRALLDDIFPGKVTPGLCYERNPSIERNAKFKAILEAILIENLFANIAPLALAATTSDEIKSFLQIINKVSKEKFNKFNIKHEFTIDGYIAGIRSLAELLVQHYNPLTSKNIEREIDVIGKYRFKEKFNIPISGDGISLVFRGHITSVRRNLTISEGNADIDITISGKGFDYPLTRHEVYADLTSLRFLTQMIKRYSVNIQTPTDAIDFLLETFAPKKVKIKNVEGEEAIRTILESRGFDVYYGIVTPKYLVETGNVIAPSYDAPYEDLIVFTPIHYVSTDLLKRLKVVFNEISLKQNFLANANVDIKDQSIFENIKSIIAASSYYRLYVDQLGYLHITFDPVNIASTFSLSLNPPITESQTISLTTASDDSNITTFVEVVPASFTINSSSEASLTTLYGRSVAPPIKDVYSVTRYLNPSEAKLKSFLKEAAKIVDSRIKQSLNDQLDANIKKLLLAQKTFINKKPPHEILDALRGGTEKKVFSTEDLTSTIVTKKAIKDDCGEKTEIIENQTIQDKQTLIKREVEVPKDLFSPTEISHIYTYSPESLLNVLDTNSFFLQVQTAAYFKLTVINLSKLASLTCQSLNSLAQAKFGLSEYANICTRGNYGIIALVMLLGLHDELLDKLLPAIRIEVSEKITEKYPYNNTAWTKEGIYFADFFYYAIPTNIHPTVTSVRLLLQNVSPDLFLYGLRTKRYRDAFVALGENLKNENRVSAQKAEIIRKLNSKPIQTAKATTIGDTYYFGFTTLVVNEKLPPLREGFINDKTLNDISDDLSYVSSDKNIIIAVNEIVEQENFVAVVKNFVPNIPGYKPTLPTSKNEVALYLQRSAEKYLNYARTFGINNPPANFYVPLWGIYDSDDLLIQEYLKYLAAVPSYTLPGKKSVDLDNMFAKLIKESFSRNRTHLLSSFQKYLRPQNYLVAQGHIEEVNFTWAVSDGYKTTISLNYLHPAMFTYLPLPNGEKLILGYAVLDSPLSKYRESGLLNRFFSHGNEYINVIDEFRKQKAEFYKFYKSTLQIIESKSKIKLLSIINMIEE